MFEDERVRGLHDDIPMPAEETDSPARTIHCSRLQQLTNENEVPVGRANAEPKTHDEATHKLCFSTGIASRSNEHYRNDIAKRW